jgi:hypothetical protein
VIYAGGESSRVYRGQWRVLGAFTWPDGSPGWEATAPGTYEDAALRCQLLGLGLPIVVSDGSTLHRVRVERALIVPYAEA